MVERAARAAVEIGAHGLVEPGEFAQAFGKLVVVGQVAVGVAQGHVDHVGRAGGGRRRGKRIADERGKFVEELAVGGAELARAAVEQAEPVAGEGIGGVGGVGGRDDGGGEETQPGHPGDGRGDDVGIFGRVFEVGHDELVALGFKEPGVPEQFAGEPVGLFTAARDDAPALRAALEDERGGNFQQPHGQVRHPPGGGVGGGRFDRGKELAHCGVGPDSPRCRGKSNGEEKHAAYHGGPLPAEDWRRRRQRLEQHPSRSKTKTTKAGNFALTITKYIDNARTAQTELLPVNL